MIILLLFKQNSMESVASRFNWPAP